MKSIFDVLPKAETWLLSVQTCAPSGTHCNPKLHWILFMGVIRLYESQAMVGLYSLSLFFPPSCYIYSIYLVRTAEFCYRITFWLLKFAQAVSLLIFHCIISYNQSRDFFFQHRECWTETSLLVHLIHLYNEMAFKAIMKFPLCRWLVSNLVCLFQSKSSTAQCIVQCILGLGLGHSCMCKNQTYSGNFCCMIPITAVTDGWKEPYHGLMIT